MGFINFLTLWVKDIIIVFVLISIIEIIIPNGNLKKYIDMIIGFLIIIVIIGPFIKLIYRNINMEKYFFQRTQEQIESEHSDDLRKVQEYQMRQIYTGKIKDEITEFIHGDTDYEVDSLEVFICEDEEYYGQVESMEIYLKKDREDNDPDRDAIVVDNIGKVTVGDRELSDKSVVELKDDQLKKSISLDYNVPEENIKIYLSTLGR